MPCTVEPTLEERQASAGKYKELLQTAIAYEEMCENWRIFQQELCEFLTEYCGDLQSMSVRQDLFAKYPNLVVWMREHAAADLERRQRELVIAEIKEKLSTLDDVTLAEMGFKRV